MKITYENSHIIVEDIPDFHVEQTLACGQCFHFQKLPDGTFGLTAFGRLLHIGQENNRVIFYNTTQEEFDMVWRQYFDLDRDYGAIKAYLTKKDHILTEAVDTMWGVHILRQEFFETLLSFIISQNKQIPHIKAIVAEISSRYGTYLGNLQGVEFYAFPTKEQLYGVTEEQLRECKMGFRAPYIKDAVEKICAGIIKEETLRAADNTLCEQMLMQIKGVGSKVANCCMLFGLEKREAFPVDVWVKRIMEYLYFDQKETKKEIIQAFAGEHFGVYGGYAQQYLFYYGKTVKMGVKK